MREPADRWLERGGVELHILDWAPERAGDASPVLFLHGLSSNAHYWDRLAAHLPNRRLVAPDQRGHGLTGRPPRVPPLPSGFAMDELIADAAFVIDSLGLNQPLVAGHSWGATVALELAARRPASISGLAFIDGPIQSAANLFSWEEAQGFMQPPLPRYASFGEAVDDVRRDFEGAWDDDLEPFVMSRLMQVGTSFVLTLTAEVRLELLRGLYESPVDMLWRRIEAPAAALLARGGPARVTDWRDKGARRLAREVPHVRLRWFDAPHDIPIFVPAEIAAEIEGLAAEGATGMSSEAAAGKNLEG